MQTILVAGAGKSSKFLIHYLLNNSLRNKWKIIVADGSAEAIADKINHSPYAEAAVIDITDVNQREPLVEMADIVISLMPPHLHIHLAKDCLKHKKNLITSSYISDEMREMDAEVRKAGLMFMCEMGLDPGIDHMTASKIIDTIQRVAGTITSFKSYCGGLIAPESDNNPWHYKFTWNPNNVISAGLGGSKYLFQGKTVEVPYQKIFDNAKKIKVDTLGLLAYYPNRDSLRYLSMYNLPDIKTFFRATLRNPSFTKGWQALINLGLTDMEDNVNTDNLTWHDWLRAKTECPAESKLINHVVSTLGITTEDKTYTLLNWLGIFNKEPIKANGKTSSGGILLELLLEKWEMLPEDKDMVVMQHELEYINRGNKTTLTSSMTLKGEKNGFSAMAKTVGLPMAILAKMILQNKIKPPVGVLIPNMPAIYRPLLTELAHFGIVFNDVVE